MSMQNANAAEMLEKACNFENQGKQGLANKAFEIACTRDEKEHAHDPATASLPRTAR